MTSLRGTGFVWDESYMWHNPGAGGGYLPARGWIEPGLHAENPAPKRRLRNLLDNSGLLQSLRMIRPRAATDDELLRFHTAEYLGRLKRDSAAKGGDASAGNPGDETPFGPGAFEIAALAAGGALVAVESVIEEEVDNVYALVRPPGHHAEPNEGRGFCLLGNIALSAMHAKALGVNRIAVVDWDVHHGNGTQDAFYESAEVLTVSIHQEASYPPDAGAATERGSGAGLGSNLNVPLPPGSGTGAYLAAFDRLVGPALERHAPELILVACGYDASAADPQGRMLLHSDAYRTMTDRILDLADRHAKGKVVMVQEGGYSPHYVPFCGLATVEALSGRRTEVVDPYLDAYAAWPAQELQANQEALISEIETRLASAHGSGDET